MSAGLLTAAAGVCFFAQLPLQGYHFTSLGHCDCGQHSLRVAWFYFILHERVPLA
jgi:hypothetical protein